MNELIPVVSIVAASMLGLILLTGLAIWIGHKLTLKSFAHVQPSAKDMFKKMPEGATVEADPWEEALQEPPEEESPHTKEMDDVFNNTGLPLQMKERFLRRLKEDSFGPSETMTDMDKIVAEMVEAQNGKY